MAAIGMLSTMATTLTIDAFGPISDNAGGIAEMALGSNEFKQTRNVTDVLDAAGNTTAAIGKGFAIGSACLVSLALFSAFVTRVGSIKVSILDSLVFSGLLIGSLLPYWFSGLTMKSVGQAAQEMAKIASEEIKKGVESHWNYQPNSNKCIEISTKHSIKEML